MSGHPIQLEALEALLNQRPWDVPDLLYRLPYGDVASLEHAARQLQELCGRVYDVLTGAEDY